LRSLKPEEEEEAFAAAQKDEDSLFKAKYHTKAVNEEDAEHRGRVKS
jgi:hypothetical protein